MSEQPAIPKSDDATLIADACSADVSRARQAIAVLFERHRGRVRAVALRLLRSPADADDVVQDTFVAVLEKMSTFRGESAFGSWVYRVAANCALMRLRAQAVRRGVTIDQIDEPLLEASGPEELCVARRQLRKVERAARSLSHAARQVVELRILDGEATDAVARRLGVSEDVVKVRLHRARTALLAAVA